MGSRHLEGLLLEEFDVVCQLITKLTLVVDVAIGFNIGRRNKLCWNYAGIFIGFPIGTMGGFFPQARTIEPRIANCRGSS